MDKHFLGIHLFFLILGLLFFFNKSLAQISPSHAGTYQWKGGSTLRGRGELVYGVVTITSSGRISATYSVPRYGDRNSFAGTINLSTGLASVSVKVNGVARPGLATIKIRSSSRVVFDGTYKRNTESGIITGIK
jgi:hypothetical protein